MPLTTTNQHIKKLLFCLIVAVVTSFQASALRADSPVVPPANLRSDVYASRVAEIFWDRAADPLTQYDVFRNGSPVSTAQFGISFFDAALTPSQTYTYTVIAIDRLGNRSASVSTELITRGPGGTEPAVPAPQSLRATQYSSTAAELFWDRAADPFTQYDVFRNDSLVSQAQFGISYFDRFIEPGNVYTYRVIAINAKGSRSTPANVKLGQDSQLVQPQALSVSVYSKSAAELFWTRQGPGQRYVVLRDSVLLGTTDGTSYFDNTLPGAGSYTYEVQAIDDASGRSTPASVTAVITGGSAMEPGTEPAITLAAAEAILHGVMLATNGELFEPMLEDARMAGKRLDEAAFASLANSPVPVNGVTLIEGSDGGSSTLGSSGLNGGLYTCDAGGSAALPAFRAFEGGSGYIAEFERCVLPNGTLSGRYQMIGAVPRSGNLGSEQLLNWQLESTDGNRYEVAQFDVGSRTQFADRVRTTYEQSATVFTADIAGERVTINTLELTRVTRIGRTRDFENAGDEAPIERDFADASLNASFDILAPYSSGQRLAVEIDLGFDYAGIDDPSYHWQTGGINVMAEDGSNMRATVLSDGSDTVRIQVNEEFIDLPYSVIAAQ